MDHSKRSDTDLTVEEKAIDIGTGLLHFHNLRAGELEEKWHESRQHYKNLVEENNSLSYALFQVTMQKENLEERIKELRKLRERMLNELQRDAYAG